mmetsp:Transcript_44872/g.118934  ORF Transcript_44872/g.118934 Transcript_44872/m.118934 type:complete len:341 (-) Transcript_44872:283-1305(-)
MAGEQGLPQARCQAGRSLRGMAGVTEHHANLRVPGPEQRPVVHVRATHDRDPVVDDHHLGVHVDLLRDWGLVVHQLLVRPEAVHGEDGRDVHASVTQALPQDPESSVLPVHDVLAVRRGAGGDGAFQRGQERQHDHDVESVVLLVGLHDAAVDGLRHAVADHIVAVQARAEELVLDVHEALGALDQVAVRGVRGGLSPRAGAPAPHGAHHLGGALVPLPTRFWPASVARFRHEIHQLVVAHRDLAVEQCCRQACVLWAHGLGVVPPLDAVTGHVPGGPSQQGTLHVLPGHAGLVAAVQGVPGAGAADVDEILDAWVRIVLAVPNLITNVPKPVPRVVVAS